MIVSITWPSVSTTLIERATPTNSEAASTVSIPFRKSVAVVERSRPDMRPMVKPTTAWTTTSTIFSTTPIT